RPVVPHGALRVLPRKPRGVPRLINAVADRALLGAYTLERPEVDAAIVRRAAAEVLGVPGRPWRRWGRRGGAVAVVAIGGGAGLVLLAPGELDHSERGRAGGT